MLWQTSASVAIIAAELMSRAYAIADCHTIYGSKSSSNVPTSTTTKTANVTSTSTTLSSVYETSTTIRPTYISIVGKKTITIPTGPSFTPLISAPTEYTTNGPVQSNAVAEPVAGASASSTAAKSSSTFKTSSYPKSVACSTTITSTHTTTLTTDATITDSTWSTAVSTSQVATSTAYAACGSKNLVSKFHGQDPLVGDDYGAQVVYACDYTPNYGTEGQIDCLNARTCCEGVQRNNYRGYQFYVYGGANHCFYFTDDWAFTTIKGVTSDSVLGNGPAGSGVYQNVTYSD